jgi:hypothetical protein
LFLCRYAPQSFGEKFSALFMVRLATGVFIKKVLEKITARTEGCPVCTGEVADLAICGTAGSVACGA